MRREELCVFEVLPGELDEGSRVCRCVRCGRLTAPTKSPLDRIFAKCRKALPDGYWATLECVHRGEVLRVIDCQVCGMRDKRVPVYECSVKGECTEKRATYRAMPAVCLGCSARERPAD